MSEHVCNMRNPWPVGHPLPPVDPAKLQGPEVGEMVTYHRVLHCGEGDPVVWHKEVTDVPALVLERSYVWSPGECRHKGGYRRYDWSVITVYDPERSYTVVVNDTDLKESAP